MFAPWISEAINFPEKRTTSSEVVSFLSSRIFSAEETGVAAGKTGSPGFSRLLKLNASVKILSSQNGAQCLAEPTLMKSMRCTCLLALLIVLFLTRGVAAMGAEVWGTAHNGLQMSLSAPGRNDLKGDFKVSLRNASDHDIMLNVGLMLAPAIGSVPSTHYQYPDAITLIVVDPAGKSTEARLIGPPGVAGSLEPLEVPLPPGAMYSLQTTTSKYFLPQTMSKGRAMAGQSYVSVQLTAKLTSKVTATGANINRHYWTGTVKSNTVSIKL
ncbi:hypothetical protein BH10CYA1_BH10CYA1_04110 [soil metagenome]